MDLAVDKARMQGQFLHVILTMLAAGIISTLFHKPALIMMVLAVNWMTSIFIFGAGAIPRWRIVASVATSAVVMSLFYLFLFGKYLP